LIVQPLRGHSKPMTTTSLQLAIDIATAARKAKTVNLGAVAVLHTLDQQGAWFCRSVEDPDGLTRDEPLPKPTPVKRRSKDGEKAAKR